MRARVLALGLSLVVTGLLAGCTKNDTSAPEKPGSPSLIPEAKAMTALAASDAAAPLPSTRFVGRWVKDGTAMRCAWSGCFVTAKFTGTAISARLKDDGFNLLQVVVDGDVKKVLRLDNKKGETSYLLADGLPEGTHEVSIHKRAEAKVGDILFYAFEPRSGEGPGKLLPGMPPPERRIELLGDSITTGYGNEGPGAACGYVNSEQNEYLTYGAITARNLNADHSTIAWSGKTQYEMRQYFDKSLPQNSSAAKWDFGQWQPQVLVLNVGTNDFANVDPGESRFVRQYLELVRDVRAAYPKTFLVIALGPMLSDIYPEGRQNLTKARRYFKVIVEKLKTQGETNYAFLEFPEQNHADGLGCGFHPSLKTHKLMADRLTALIKEHTSW
jgi:lysophospholipase L1-like esterase